MLKVGPLRRSRIYCPKQNMTSWTAQQRDIVESPLGNAVVVACAGSGKTAVIVERVGQLCASGRLAPDKVTVITFTNLAAAELQTRVALTFQKLGLDGFPWTGTIHSFCLHHLRQYDPEFGDSASVMTEGKLFALLFQKYKEWGLAAFGKEESAKTYVIEKVIRTLEHISLHSIDPSVIKERSPEFFALNETYSKWSVEHRSLDYQQILSSFYKRLSERGFQDYLAKDLDYLIVDEYQDTDPLQDQIFLEISKQLPVMAVGDDDQCIYQFRGTTHTNILTYTDRFTGATSLPLAKNFRSGGNIVSAAATVAEQLPDRLSKPFEHHWEGGLIRAMQFDSVDDEARFVAEEVRFLKEKDVISDYSEVALLFRSVSSTAAPYLSALDEAGIPAIAYGDRGLFGRHEVQRVMASLEFIQRSELLRGDAQIVGDVAGFSIMNDTDGRLPAELEAWSESHWKMVGATDSQAQTIGAVFELRHRYAEQKLTDCHSFLFEVFEALGFRSASTTDLAHRNLAILTGVVGDYQEIVGGKSIRMLVNYLNSYARKKFDSAQPAPGKHGAVNVVTVHQAKGLQYHAVFCPMLVHGKFPVIMPETLLAVELNDSSERAKHRLNEERRLFYVAMTRAVAHLYVTYPKVGKNGRKLRASEYFYDLEKCAGKESDYIQSRGTPRPEESLVTSYSRVEYYLSCPYRYWILFDVGYKTPQNPVFALGRLLHLILRLLHESYIDGAVLCNKELERLYNENFPDLSRLPPLARKRLARNMLKAIRNYQLSKSTWLEQTENTELPFSYRTSIETDDGSFPLEIIGQIDLITGGGHIVDFKSGKPHDYIRTDLQLAVYALAYEQHAGRRAEAASVHYVEHDVTKTYEPSESWLAEFVEVLSQAASGIVAQRFDPTPGEVCTRCEVRRICAYRRGK